MIKTLLLRYLFGKGLNSILSTFTKAQEDLEKFSKDAKVEAEKLDEKFVKKALQSSEKLLKEEERMKAKLLKKQQDSRESLDKVADKITALDEDRMKAERVSEKIKKLTE